MIKNLVSIITPNYNCAPFIAETIKCIQAQTYQQWELIIVDDHSSDDSLEQIKKFLADSRIRLIVNDSNQGAAISRNKALREAKGEWIAFLDSDDLWLPTKLEKQLDFMQKNNYYFSYTQYREINEDGSSMQTLVSGPNHIGVWKMWAYCWPGCLTIMYNADKVGLIQIADIRKNNDYAMWLQVIRKADCHLLREPLSYYRHRHGSISRNGIVVMIKWHYFLFKKAMKLNPVFACICTIQNLLFGSLKKLVYVSLEA